MVPLPKIYSVYALPCGGLAFRYSSGGVAPPGLHGELVVGAVSGAWAGLGGLYI